MISLPRLPVRKSVFQRSGGSLVFLALICVALVCSRIVANQAHDSYLILRFLGSICLMSAISIVSLATGLGIVGTKRPGLFSISLAFLVGYGLCGMLIFIIGLAHGLYSGIIAVVLLGLGLISRRSLNDLPGIYQNLSINYRHSSRSVRLTMAAVAAYVCFLLVVSLGPIHAWDAHAFHWTVAKYFARHHAVPFPYFDGNGGTPHLMHMLYTTFCVFGFDHQASLANWMLMPALIGLVYGVVRRLSASAGSLVITMAAFIFLVLRPQIITEPMLDFPVLVFGLGAFICALMPLFDNVGNGDTRQPIEISYSRLLVLSGVLTGYAIGVKWHAAVLLPVILIVYLFVRRPILPALSRIRLLVSWLVLACAPSVVFLVYNYIYTGNPLWHPMISAIWEPDYWADVESNILVWRTHMEFLRQFSYPSPMINPLGALSCYLRSNVLVLPGMFLAMIALLAGRRRVRMLTVCVWCGGLFCLLAHSILVGTSPRNTLLGTGIILLLIPIGWDHLWQSKYRNISLIVPLLAIGGLVYKIADLRLPMVEQYATRTANVLDGPYFDQQYRQTFHYQATGWINDQLPADARIITDLRLLGNLDRDWMTIWPVAQCVVAVSPEISADSLRQALQSIGITHLMVDKNQLWANIASFPLMADYLAPWKSLLTRREWLNRVYTDRFVDVFQFR